MSETSKARATEKYFRRLAERGLVRFEVLGRDVDRAVVRLFAKCLSEGGEEAQLLRAAVGQAAAADLPRKGGILEALRRSPLVDVDAIARRPRVSGREVQL